MKITNDSKSNGIGFCSLLTLAFIVLKLCEVINWSWWWILAPIWIPAAIIIAILIFIVVIKSIVD